ncbi:carboxypeptidase-like regulatory domain-containing protein [Terriglobus roseus]|nr:carboxypeptidase-like regulatory domain-containing protein [Terriglobus roseus]
MSIISGVAVAYVLGSGLLSSHAQTNYGSVRGVVKDSQGASITNAKVTLTSERTHTTRDVSTNGGGIYFFGSLDPGRYTVRVVSDGFKTSETNVAVAIGATASVDVSLVAGGSDQSVTVTATSEEVPNRTNATNGQLFDERKLQDLPNLGRNPFIMDKLDNNVVPTGNPQQARAEDQNMTSSVSIAGAPIGTNGYVVDGIPTSTSAGIVTFIPSLEAVTEVKVQANTYDAEAGRVGGGLYNATLKSGSGRLHGVLYGETRQTGWSANSFYSNLTGAPRPGQATYLYTGALGGPLPIDKIPGIERVPLIRGKYFFWVSEDGYRQQQPYAASSTAVFVPSAAERVGDFTAEGNPGRIEPILYDPTTYPRKQIVGLKNGVSTPNYIPGSGLTLNAIGQYIANAYPPPNVTLNTSQAYGTGNRALPYDSLKTRSDMYSGKLDHQFNDRWNAAASYVHLATQEPSGSVLHVAAQGTGVLTRYIDATAVNNTIVLSPTTLLNVAYGFNRYYSTSPQYSSGFNQANGFGGIGFPAGFVSQLQSESFPTISPSGAATLGGANSGPTINYSRNFVVGLTKTVGKHNLKAGYVYRALRLYTQSFSGGNGSYIFNGQYTSANGASATTAAGSSIADLLLGAPSAASITINAPNTLQRANYNAIYVQDDLRATNDLTLNVGVRFEFEPGQDEAHNRNIVGFDRSVNNPLPTTGSPLRGGVMFAGQNGYTTRCCSYGAVKVSPRFGVAYSFDRRTVIRGGFGLFYSPVALTNYSPGYSQTTTYSTTNLTGAVAASSLGSGGYLSNPFPSGLLQPTGNSLGYLTGVGGAITAIDSARRYPFVQQYSVDLQRELPARVLFKIGYVGARARNFPNTVNINQLPNSALAGANGTSLATSVTNPFYASSVGGYPSTGVVAQKTVPRAQLLLPFPQFTSVTLSESNGYSRYNSLAIKAERNVGKNLVLLATYTWSSNWDSIYSSISAPATSNNLNATSGPQDNTNTDAEYARASDNVPNRFTFVVQYNLPFGRGRTFLGNANRWVDAVIGGWQINDETILQDGGPLTITQTNLNSASQFGTTGVGGSVQRPNLVPGIPIAKSGRPQRRLGPQQNGTETYFNTAAFTVAPAYTYGNAPRTLPVYGPGYSNSDISLNKSFPFGERVNVQFRAEALNAFNTPEFAAPVAVLPVNTATQTVISGSTFGQITSQINYSRIIQLGGRLSF